MTRMTAKEALQRLNEESLPDFVEPLTDVNQVGTFGNRPIHIASYWGETDLVAALIAGGAEVNVKGDLGSTPLHEAAGEGNAETVKYLLAHGAKTNIKNELGKLPADLAREQRSNEIVELLESAVAASHKP